MRVALATGWFFPESTGGTEVYVASLARELVRLGAEVEIGTATTTLPAGRDHHQGIPLTRWSVAGRHHWRVLRGIEPPGGMEVFRQWLRDGRFDVYHQHSWTMGCGIHHLIAARELGLRCFLTIHIPERIFTRGRFMESVRVVYPPGRRRPDESGWMNPARLSLAAYENIPGKLGSALGILGRVLNRWVWLWDTARHCERVVVVSRWLREALVANSYPAEKLVVCRQGVDAVPPARPAPPERGAVSFCPERPLVLGYLGRFTAIKGVDVLCEAVARLPAGAPVELRLAGPEPRDAADRRYFSGLRDIAARDPRVRFVGEVPRATLADFFAGVDILAVPSRWLETGPLVAMEALAHGVPILGARRGGLIECLEDAPGCGVLVSGDTARDWASAISKILDHPADLAAMRAAAANHRPRTMADVAREMSLLYDSAP